MGVLNVHLVPNEGFLPRTQLGMLRDSIAPLREAVSIVMGDFNPPLGRGGST